MHARQGVSPRFTTGGNACKPGSLAFLQRSPPRIRNLYPHNVHRSAAALVSRGDEPIDHKAGQRRYREALRHQHCFGGAVRIIGQKRKRAAFLLGHTVAPVPSCQASDGLPHDTSNVRFPNARSLPGRAVFGDAVVSAAAVRQSFQKSLKNMNRAQRTSSVLAATLGNIRLIDHGSAFASPRSPPVVSARPGYQPSTLAGPDAAAVLFLTTGALF